MANLNLDQDVANKKNSCSYSGQILSPVRMRRYGSLIKINPSQKYKGKIPL